MQAFQHLESNKKLNMLKKILIFLFILFVIIIASNIYFLSKLNDPIGGDNRIVEMPDNASVSFIVKTFNKQNMLEPQWLYTINLKIYSLFFDLTIYRGVYKFTPDNTNLDVIRSVFTGKQQYIVKITYPEGITLSDFAHITAKFLEIDSAKFVNYCNSPTTLKKYDIEAKTAEGYLAPDTYDFYYNATIEKVCDKLLKQQMKVWNGIKSKYKNKPKLNKHQIMTLASIIEAEAPIVKERPIVAGLYLNRLRIGMKLDADPTVQYALKGKKKLMYRDLKVKSPYNTYIHKGLPPGPICSPGKSAIEAVFNYSKNNYLYFVAKGNKSGEHYFSTNFRNHVNNKLRYKHNKKMN